MRSAYTGSHLVSNFPDMPSGLVNPLKNQKDVKFIETRQAALDTYLDRLLHLAKAPSNPDMMLFLGMDPVTGAERPPETHTREEDGGRSSMAFDDSVSASWGSNSEGLGHAPSTEGVEEAGGGELANGAGSGGAATEAAASAGGGGDSPRRAGAGLDASQADRVAF